MRDGHPRKTQQVARRKPRSGFGVVLEDRTLTNDGQIAYAGTGRGGATARGFQMRAGGPDASEGLCG